MDKDTRVMLKKVAIYDIIILLIGLVISMVAFKAYSVVVIIGILLALANFILNAIITNYTFIVSGSGVFLMIGAIARIIITVIVALVLCKDNPMNVIAFLVGYTSHYVAVAFYGATLKRKEVIK